MLSDRLKTRKNTEIKNQRIFLPPPPPPPSPPSKKKGEAMLLSKSAMYRSK